jgi:signal recognition particle subunit SRP19
MVSRDDKIFVIWPEYFDINLSRSEGRRVPKKYSVQSPRVEDIAKAAKLLGLKPIVEEDRAYPGKWWKKSGRVLVPKKLRKQKILLKIGQKLKKTKKSN